MHNKNIIIVVVTFILVLITVLMVIAAEEKNPWVKGPLPDALTRATDSGYAEYEGKLEHLYDGRIPGGLRRARPLYWNLRGVFLIVFKKPVVLKELKCYVGEDDGIFQVKGFLGGEILSDGTGNIGGVKKFEIKNVERKKNSWVSFTLSEPDTVDNIQFWTMDSCDIYELRAVTVNDSTPASGIQQTKPE